MGVRIRPTLLINLTGSRNYDLLGIQAPSDTDLYTCSPKLRRTICSLSRWAHTNLSWDNPTHSMSHFLRYFFASHCHLFLFWIFKLLCCSLLLKSVPMIKLDGLPCHFLLSRNFQIDGKCTFLKYIRWWGLSFTVYSLCSFFNESSSSWLPEEICFRWPLANTMFKFRKAW